MLARKLVIYAKRHLCCLLCLCGLHICNEDCRWESPVIDNCFKKAFNFAFNSHLFFVKPFFCMSVSSFTDTEIYFFVERKVFYYECILVFTPKSTSKLFSRYFELFSYSSGQIFLSTSLGEIE